MMKNILIFFMIVGGLTSCSKDSLDVYPKDPTGPEQSEIMVRVSYLSWSGDQCEPGCGGTAHEDVSMIANAEVYLFKGEITSGDAEANPLMTLRTDVDGAALLQDLEPDTYTVTVVTVLGTKTRKLNTQLNKRSYIDFSY